MTTHLLRYKTLAACDALLEKYGARVTGHVPEARVLQLVDCTCEELEREPGVECVGEDCDCEPTGDAAPVPDPDFEWPIQHETLRQDGRAVIGVVDLLAQSHGKRVVSIAGAQGSPVRGYPAGSVFQSIESARDAIRDGCKVVNLSFIGGTPFWDGVFHWVHGLAEAGYDVPLIVTAAGGSVNLDQAPIQPAACVSPYNLTVGACDMAGGIRGGTSWGHAVDLMAVESAPSWAAPMVAALAAYLRDLGLRSLDVRAAIVEGVRVAPALDGVCASGGIMDWMNTVGPVVEDPPDLYPDDGNEEDEDDEGDTMPINFVKTVSKPEMIVSVDGENAGRGEGLAQLLDGKPGTKWLKFAGEAWFSIAIEGDRMPAALLLRSGNDRPERDPTFIHIIDAHTGEVVLERALSPWTLRQGLQRVELPLEAMLANRLWMHVRNEMTGEPGKSTGPIIQLSELDFEWVDIPTEVEDLADPEALLQRLKALEENHRELAGRVTQLEATSGK